MKTFTSILFLFGIALVCHAKIGVPCPERTTNCYCSFANNADPTDSDVDTNAETRATVMATAAGALGPLVLGGMGLGIWKLVTRTKDADKSDDLWSQQRGGTPDYGSRRGSNGSVSMFGTDDEISFANSRAGSAVDLTRPDGEEPKTRPHPSHNWGSNSPYPGSQSPRNPRSLGF